MITFTLSIVLALLAVVAQGGSRLAKKSAKLDERAAAKPLALGSIVLAVLALLTFAKSVTYIVPTKQVGIPVTFGKPHAGVGNGIHTKAPWTKIVLMDETVQIDDHLGDHRSEIRLGNQSVAFVQNSVRWHIRTDAADQLYRDHKEFDRIQPSLVEPELSAALNASFVGYSPLTAAAGQGKSLDQYATEVKKRLNERIGDRIVIDSVIIPKVDFDEATQKRIDAYQTEIGNTRIAQQREKTAAADAAANRTLSSSVSKDPNVLVSKCLDQLAEMVQKGQDVPAGFSCWPGSNASVIANPKTSK